MIWPVYITLCVFKTDVLTKDPASLPTSALSLPMLIHIYIQTQVGEMMTGTFLTLPVLSEENLLEPIPLIFY